MARIDPARWPAQWLRPDWPAELPVRAVVTTRDGHGCSAGPYAHLNLGIWVGDQAQAVADNRALLGRTLGLPGEPHWLQQVHGSVVIDDQARSTADRPTPKPADAAITEQIDVVLAVLTADCLPLFLAASDGSEVALVHAGWRGLAAGVIEACVRRMRSAPNQLLAWLGPAIGPTAFEVGAEVRDALCADDPAAAAAFKPRNLPPDQPAKWFCDLYLLARLRLHRLGVGAISGGGLCTHSDATRFYSYRRDAVTGRMASLIWREEG
ncbi:MAG: peptidoglycan editing factor PgeF [Lysobacterales bacterium]